MFDLLHTSFFRLSQQKYYDFEPVFEDLFSAYKQVNGQYTMPAIKLLALLYQLKEFTGIFNQVEDSFKSPHQILFQKYVKLVNHFFLEKRTVEEYANLLLVSSNHLSKSIKLISNRNALSFINERLVNEAKLMIRYADLDIAEIAYQLHFTDSSNFGKFFKKHTDLSPLEYKKSNTSRN
jgi:AraC family transcriptional regulator, transcriptional activator of pobA